MGIFLPSFKHEATAELAAQIQTFISIVIWYARPLRMNECENPNCPRRPGQLPQLVVINDIPQFLCQDCLDALPGMAKKHEAEFKQAPNHLAAGLVTGASAALLFAVVWAGIALALRGLVIFVGPLALIGMVRLMDKIGTKRSMLSLAMAGGLTLLSTFLGNFLFEFLLMIRYGAPVKIGTLGTAWNDMFEAPRMLGLTTFFTVLLAGSCFLQYLSQHRKALKEAFNPIVEVLL